MHKIEMTFGDFNLDAKRLTETFNKILFQKMRQAARMFLRTAIQHIPVWTGEAMGSLAPIAHELHVSIPKVKDPEAPYDGFSLGVSQAVGSEPFIKQDGFVFSFTIGTNVPHFQINDRYDVSRWGFKLRNPTPWNAFELGRLAAVDYLRQQPPKFPKYTDFMVKG